MLRSLETAKRGHFDPEEAIDSVTLDLDARRKRRQTLTGAAGTRFLIDLPAVPSVRDGDGFRLESGDVIEVRAAPEVLIEVRPPPACADDLARFAWHVGNRHLAVQFIDGAFRLRYDHVIEDMLIKLGARTRKLELPFEPESGAYSHAPGHRHA